MNENDFLKEMEDWDKNRFFLWRWIDSIGSGSFLGYSTTYILSHPWKGIETIADEIRWAWQRIFIGHDERVAWSIDYWMDEHMPMILNDLKIHGHGIPMVCFEEMKPINNNWEYSEENNKKAKQIWNQELDKMIAGFKAHKQLDDYNYEGGESDNLEKIFDEGMASFVKYYGNLWD